MVTKTDKIVFGSIAVVVVLILVFGSKFGPRLQGENSLDLLSKGDIEKKEVKGEKNDLEEETIKGNMQVVEKWDMPEELREISALTYLGDGLFACVQDEEGSIFFYNTRSKKIERKIKFGEPGDYEDITHKGNTAYVVNSSGEIFQVENINATPSVKKYKTSLTAKNDVEGICLDESNNRLLLTVKKESNKEQPRGIYAFALSTNRFINEPVFVLEQAEKGKSKKGDIKPSSIAIHPANGDIYVLEGTNPKLMILDKTGKQKQLFSLDKNVFAQPEGIAFTPEGDMYISNEGQKGKGNILKVELK